MSLSPSSILDTILSYFRMVSLVYKYLTKGMNPALRKSWFHKMNRIKMCIVDVNIYISPDTSPVHWPDSHGHSNFFSRHLDDYPCTRYPPVNTNLIHNHFYTHDVSPDLLRYHFSTATRHHIMLIRALSIISLPFKSQTY